MDAGNTPLDSVSLVQLPACRVVWVDEPMKVDGSADMEAPIRKLDQSDAEAVVFLGKVGLGISAEHLRKAETSQYDGIFLTLIRRIFTQEKRLTCRKRSVCGFVFAAVIRKRLYSIKNCWIILKNIECR